MGKKKKSKSKPPRAREVNHRQYEGARRARFDHWGYSGSSADSELYTSLRALRDRSRDLVRNNPNISHAVQQVIPNNVIGSGIGFQSQVKKRRGDRLDDRINSQIEEAWQEWQHAQYCHTAGKLSFPDIERLIVTALVQDGEVFVRKVQQSFGGSMIPLALEIIEADQVCETHARGSYGDNIVKMGIELDMWQRPVAYHLYPYHPGDNQFMTAKLGSGLIRVPAEEIIHIFITDRPGQTRGVPWLHAIINRARQLGKFEEAAVTKAQVQALVAAVIESPDPESLGIPVEGDGIRGERYQFLDPGEFYYLQPGERLQSFVPSSPVDDGNEFIKNIQRTEATGLGISFEEFTGNYSDTNYSSTRASVLRARDNYRFLQGFIVRIFREPLFPGWMDLAVLSGRLKIDDYFQNRPHYLKPKFTCKGWDWVDPAKDVAAKIAQVKAGMTTLTDVASEAGRDFEDLVKTRQRELALLKMYGISTDTEIPVMPVEPEIMTEKNWKQQKTLEIYRRNQAQGYRG